MTTENKAALDIPQIIYNGNYTKGEIGYCSSGRWAGWIFWKHPDGQWVSLAKIPQSPTAPPVDAAEALALIKHYAYCSERAQESMQPEFDKAMATLETTLTGDCDGGDFSQAIEDIRFVRKALAKQWINKMEREFVEETHMRINRIEAALTAPAADVEGLKREVQQELSLELDKLEFAEGIDMPATAQYWRRLGTTMGIFKTIDRLAARGYFGNVKEK